MAMVIFNSSPLINLAKLEKLEIVEGLFDEIIIPRAVYEEVFIFGRDKKCNSDLNNLLKKGTIKVIDVKDKNLVKAFRKDIDYGESEVIALALETNAELIVIDEIDARKVADIYEIKKTGFLGLLIKAKKMGLITENLKEVIDKAIDLGFWINRKLYQEIIYRIN